MTKDGILGLLLLVFVVAELVTGFSSNTLHFLLGMTIITGLNYGD